MRSAIPILIGCLYALSAVDATPFSKAGNAEVQQGNVKAAEPQQLWSEDKGDDDNDDEHKGEKGGKNGHNGDECATRSVSIMIGSSTFAIPCLGGDAVVDINGLIPAALPSLFPSPLPSSTVVSSSAASSSVSDSITSTAESSLSSSESSIVATSTDGSIAG
ncbi:hypothetical protein K450DRAFT_240694 [Umbelopsis ramanniana AG]|uniref:Uncharacterized protein n=1 Tax=Umbelopsis ramanniana AG TaxID=1314678 RepID=A0AAD5EBE7_UMBRA|nr:uncharacterized protein K450DRAFT_240694 [Umbelopsis ramanniana AG]KAI8579866.1 hypothetical protein K450DRAFT_240694 [Umbelopsis ramanniana AG]